MVPKNDRNPQLGDDQAIAIARDFLGERPPPDFLIATNDLNAAGKVVGLANAAHVNTILLNYDLDTGYGEPHTIVLFDRDLRLGFINHELVAVQGYPAEVARPGTSIYDVLRFQAARGDFGPCEDIDLVARSQRRRRIDGMRAYALRLHPG